MNQTPSSATVTPESIRAGQVVDLAGIAASVRASDHQRASALAATLRIATPVEVPATITVRFEDGAFEHPAPTRRDELAVHLADDDIAFVQGAHTLVARVSRDDIEISGDAPDLALAIRRLFWLALAHLFAQRDRHVVHAAMFAIDDGCLLAFGPTGAGKSTLALAALHAGWTVLGDDIVVIDDENGVIHATALPRPIVVPADIVGATSATPVPGDARGRVELDQRVEGSSVYPVRACLAVAHGDRPHATVEDLAAIDLLPTVLSACFATHDGASVRALLPLAATISRFPALQLAHGTDLATRLDDGAAALQDVRERITRLAAGARSGRT